MDNIDRRLLLGAAGLAGAAALSRLAHAGPLTPPPGPVTPTGLTLDQLAAIASRSARPGGLAEPRIPVTAETCPPSAFAAVNITQPGSYYLTGDLAFATPSGIYIQADDVTLDLCGYAVRPQTPGSGDAIHLNGSRIALRDGVVAGSSRGVLAWNSNRQNHLLEDLRISCASTAIFLASSSAARRCFVRGGAGIEASGQNSVVSECHVAGSAGYGITLAFSCTAERCHIFECAAGLYVGPKSRAVACSTAICGQGVSGSTGVLLQDCTVGLSTVDGGGSGLGISVGDGCTVTGCRVDENAGGGIVAGQRSSIDRCDVTANTGRGISVGAGSRVTRCTVSNHTTGAGPAGVKLLGNNCIVEENYFTNNTVAVDAAGVSNNLVARNTCLGNANFIAVSAGGNWYPNTPLGGVNTATNPLNNIIG